MRRRGVRAIAVIATACLLGTLAPIIAPQVAVAAGTVVFQNAFNTRTSGGSGIVTVPATPSGTNGACLTVSGNTSTPPLYSCANASDTQGNGKLRFTDTGYFKVGGIIGGLAVPTANGLDVTFNTYQWGGNGADGIAFLLAAVDPANPAPPASTGPFGGALGYSVYPWTNGLANAYLGVGLDVFGNFSNSSYSGTGCTNPAHFGTPTPGAVVVRGPGNGRVGYCGLNTTYNGTAASKLNLRASTRAASRVPVQMLINPTSASFTSDSGQTVAANSYKIVVTPVGQTARTLSGTLPSVPSGLYPSASWLNANGVPKQLAVGITASSGGATDVHEVSDVAIKTFDAVPRLAVSTTSYAAATLQPGDPVNYRVGASVQTGVAEPGAVSVTQTVPTGVVPVGAFGSGWVCNPPAGQSITCTTAAAGFAQGTTLPVLNVVGIATGTSVTSSVVQSSSPARVSSPTGASSTDTTASGANRPQPPSGVAVSPTIGSVSGGGAVTVSGTNITGATAIEIGTTSEQRAGTPVVLLPCPGAAAAGCFTVSGNNLVISSMPARASPASVTVTVVTLGIAGAANYTYADRPARPATPTATAGVSGATVTWSAPATNGSAITGYVVTRYLNGTPQGTTTYDASTTTRTLSGLTPGGSYTFTVAAVNAYGTSDASSPSAAVVPYAVPDAPTITAVSAGSLSALLTWTAPNGNGRPVTGYIVTPYVGTTAQPARTFAGIATTRILSGLIPGNTHTFTVAAQNSAGTGPASAKSAAVTPNRSPSLDFPEPPDGEVGVPYREQLTVTDGTGPFTWSVSVGSLPPGLTLNSSSGLLSGTPTAAGGYPFTVEVVDASGEAATRSVTIMIAAPPAVTFSPAAGEVGVAYSQKPTRTGGTAPFTWSVSSGTLPDGLTLDTATGAVSGSPSAAGSFPVTVTVTDAFGQTASRAVTLVIVPRPAFTAATPPGGQVGVAYSHPLAVTGGAQPLTWSLTAGSLPPGLSLAPSTGLVSGTPTTVGSWSATVTVTDANGQTATKAITLAVAPGPLVITKSASTSSAAPGTVVSYTITVANTGTSAFTGVSVSDPLGGVLDDATYGADATATSGTPSYSSSTLRWTGNLAAGATVTIRYSVTVDDPATGNKELTGTATSTTLGTNCAAGSTDGRCAATVTVPGLTIVKSADTTTTTPGSTVRVSIVVTNTGRTAFPAATVTDGLDTMLDEATYDGNATATSGTVSYNRPSLTWTGGLAPGASATIAYTVSVADPATGDRVLSGTALSATPGSTCPPGNPGAACTVSVPVLVPALSITNSASTSSVTPGDPVQYTVTLANTGQTPYTGTSVTVALGDALDDAGYAGDAAATAGSVAFHAGPATLTWTGDLAVGATVVVTASVTVRSPDPGDKMLTTVVSSAAPGSTCRPGAPQPSCTATVQVLVPALTIATSTDASTSTPGSAVRYTVTATNSGQTPYTGATLRAGLSGILDDAAYANDVAATRGSASVTGDVLTWTGDLAVGATATVTFSVTVDDPPSGNRSLTTTVTSSTTGSNCATGSTDPACASTVAVLIPGLEVRMTPDASTATPGSVVRYTFTARNTGQTTYTGISVSADIAAMTDDADYNYDASVSSGSLVFSPDGSSVAWVGTLAPGASLTGSMSMTVRSPASGDRVIAGSVIADAPGSNCRPGSADPSCRAMVTVLVPGLTITTSASTSTTQPGDTVGYTTVAVNDGETTHPAATVSHDLSRVLPDAVYAGDATATSGTVSFDGTALRWTGALAPGESATITYWVTVRDPDPGDKLMHTVVESPTAGSNCPAGSTDPRCGTRVQVLVPALTVTQTADRPTTVPGDTVGFTVTASNSGTAPLAAAAMDVDLADVLDDAVYGADADADTGTVTRSGATLRWTGALAVGASVAITYSATVRADDVGDDLVSATAISRTAGTGNCAAGSADPRCAPAVPVARLVLEQHFSQPTATPGSVLYLYGTYTNTGRVPYTGITVSTPGADIGDDALATGDQTASSGSLTLNQTAITWNGSIPVGADVRLRGTVTVKNPAAGNKILTGTLISTAPGNNCAAGSTDDRCTARTTVLEPVLSISTAASSTATMPGATVGYTTTVHNPGPVAYDSATVVMSLAGVLDEATGNGDAAATVGALTAGPSTLTWTGPLDVGETATITYSVTVSGVTADKLLASSVSSTAMGSSCPPASGNPACHSRVVILTPELTISKTADRAHATLGATVDHTIHVANTGQTSYPAAEVTDALADVLDDATYNGDAAATAGTVGVTGGVLTWSGALAPGDSATVTFSVTVNVPTSGDRRMSDTVASPAMGANCAAGATDTRCTTTVPVVDSVTLTFTKTADVAAAAAGDRVRYTIAVTNASEDDETAVELTDPLAGVLDDATYNGDAAASAGTVALSGDDLSWTGPVPALSTVTVTYSVTVTASPGGDEILAGTVRSTSLPSSNNCVAGSPDPRCTSSTPVAALRIEQSFDRSSATPGSVVRLNATFTNTGQLPYQGIRITGSADAVTDDATANGDHVATSGTLVLSATAITWTGDIPVGASVTVTGTVTVNDPPTGDGVLSGTLVSDALGANCPAGATDGRCTARTPVLQPGLKITKFAASTVVQPGGTASYTITVANTGETPYTGVTVTDTLVGVLDDAGYDGDATATSGTVSFDAPVLTWTGDLAVGATATIGYSVTTRVPATGDKIMAGAVSSTAAGNNCKPASGDPACRATVLVLTPALTLASTAGAATAVPGATVTYTVTAANTGQVAYGPATVTVGLDDVLDDATYGAASATTGTVARSGTTLTWTGALAPGTAATISYVVTVGSPPGGNSRLTQTVASAEQGSTCPPGGTDPRCVASVPVAGLRVTNAADASTTSPTSAVTTTVTLTNTGQVDYRDAAVVVDLAGTLDDAAYTGDAATTAGNLAYETEPGRLLWTGNLPVGATVVVTGSVTVHNPPRGDHDMRTLVTTDAPAANCPAANPGAGCATSVRVLLPALALAKTADTSAVTPGGTVGYTLTIANSGETPYRDATVTDVLSSVLDDATYTGDAQASRGSVGVADGTLTWTGDLAVGESAVVTYGMRVNDPNLGDGLLVNGVRSAELGSSCPEGTGPSCRTLVAVLVPALDVAVTADSMTTTPGAKVGYTVTVANTGQTPYHDATVTTLLVGVLDDAAYTGGATASLGSVAFAEPELTWTGDLPVGAVAIITYTVTVADPDDGNRLLTTSVVSAEPGSTCGTGPGCASSVTVLVPGLAVSTSASRPVATPGDTVTFTLTISNTGETPYTGTVATADLTGLLDDAELAGAATATRGSVSRGGPDLRWTGDLPVGATALVRFSVTVHGPGSGDRVLAATVAAPAAGSSCPAGSANPSCTATVTVLIPELGIATTADTPAAAPGATVGYTVTVTNTGQTYYSGAVVESSFAGVLSDADYNGDAAIAAGGGTLSVNGSTITWTGDLPVGASTTFTYSATVHDPDTGGHSMVSTVSSNVPGSTCPPGAEQARCTASVRVLRPALEITATADTTAVAAGDAVHYTATVTNTGEIPYAAASMTGLLAEVLDDAAYVGDAVATSGTLSYSDGTMHWTGGLAVGESATVTYTVRTGFPATGDRTLTTRLVSGSPGARCATGTEPPCTATVAVLVPALEITKSADASEVGPVGALTYTVTATNRGEAPYRAATLTDSLADVLDDATYDDNATVSAGSVSYSDGMLRWTAALPVGATAVLTYSVTVSPDGAGDGMMINRVASGATGGNCPSGSADPRCGTRTTVSPVMVGPGMPGPGEPAPGEPAPGTTTPGRTTPVMIGLTELTPSFTLSGPPDSTVSADGVVSMSVSTNNPGGYVVSVRAAAPSLTAGTPGNNETIPIGRLHTRESGTATFRELSADVPLVVHRRAARSAPGGDRVGNDYRIDIPFVPSDTYSTTLEYVVSTQ